MDTTKALTWQQLADFCLTLTDEQKNYPISIVGEERGMKLTGTAICATDYVNPSGEGIEPIEVYTREIEDYKNGDSQFEPSFESIDDLQSEIVFPKGRPVLLIDGVGMATYEDLYPEKKENAN